MSHNESFGAFSGFCSGLGAGAGGRPGPDSAGNHMLNAQAGREGAEAEEPAAGSKAAERFERSAEGRQPLAAGRSVAEAQPQLAGRWRQGPIHAQSLGWRAPLVPPNRAG